MKVYVVLCENNGDYDWWVRGINSIHLCKEAAIDTVHKLNNELIENGDDDDFNYYMEVWEVVE